ncbi:glycosyltransferase [Derxia gummosa]|uniref:Beta-monoglucosyldiacylglycerol synthase n=1 Tax=Derxia gummosa DSM 723 TaxID=1121388 RepID=A0A8B6XA47_9BURK|nr:glycosyltransferase [Derxia gummosa]
MNPSIPKPRSRFRRAVTAFLIAAIVAAVNFGIWARLNRDAVFPDYDSGEIRGFAYNAYRRDQSPFTKVYPSDEEIEQDVKQMATQTSRLRLYSSLELPHILSAAADAGLRVTTGAWLDRNLEQNERELAAAMQAVRRYNNIDAVIVGNEALLRGDLTVEQLIDYLDRMRRATSKPVTTTEPWHIWHKYPELVKHVDMIGVHLLPYHEGVPIERGVDQALDRYFEIQKAYPKKRIVIGETGWPSKGPILGAAVPSIENEARYIREFMTVAAERKLDYYLMEAYDQPWKVDVEGWAGPYWGVYNADREAKFPLMGKVREDTNWVNKALASSLVAFVFMFIASYKFSDFRWGGRLAFSLMVQICVTGAVIAIATPVDYYLSTRDSVALWALIMASMATVAVFLSNGFEFAEVMYRKHWKRQFSPQIPLDASQEPFVSVHLACCNEPPEMVIATMDSLAALEYSNYEVLVLDNNTKDPALWKPLEQRCKELGPRFRFFHLDNWPGFKAGALNFGLKQTDPRADVVGVVDADYVVTPNWLSSLARHFLEPEVAVVQAPQAHRDYETQPFRRMCNWEFDGFFRIGMHHRNERNALIQHGTMTLVRRPALDAVGGWGEWTICEDTELGLRLLEAGLDVRYVDEILGRGLTPSDFAALKSQRFRWAFGAMQILKGHFSRLIGREPTKLNLAQRYHFLTGWLTWFGDALQAVFATASLIWTILMLHAPRTFSLPVVSLIAPVVALLLVKAVLGPILYRARMKCSWWDIFGASLASLGLSHAIARGIMAGLVKRKGEFVRTPKGWKEKGGLLSMIAPIREELWFMAALWLGAAVLIHVRGPQNMEAKIWGAMLVLQSLPYIAALGCQIAALWPDSKPAETQPEAVGTGQQPA